MGRSPLGTAPRPKGRVVVAAARRLEIRWPARCFSSACSCSRRFPHLGVLLLSFAGRWYGTVIPDELTMRHYIEALGNGLVVPSIQNSLMYAGCATLVALVIGLSRRLGRRALGSEIPRLARCGGDAAACGARAW